MQGAVGGEDVGDGVEVPRIEEVDLGVGQVALGGEANSIAWLV
jgi:hypothetical protein